MLRHCEANTVIIAGHNRAVKSNNEVVERKSASSHWWKARGYCQYNTKNKVEWNINTSLNGIVRTWPSFSIVKHALAYQVSVTLIWLAIDHQSYKQ